MEERLLKLDKRFEAVSSKKQQRSELMINGSTGALNMKVTTRMKSVNESFEERPKKICLNKRVQTSIAEFQAECQINGLNKKPVAMGKDVNFCKDSGGESDQFEKIRRMAAVEEGWDKKRRRSIGTILSRPSDSGSGVPKRAIQNRVVDERGVQQRDARISRSNDCDDSYTTCPSPPTKKKALRTTQIGSMVAARSSLGTPCVPETLKNWENAIAKETFSQERDNNTHKPSLDHCVGQRQPKVPRTRRSDLMSPVSNQDDRSPSDGTHDSPVSRSATNGSLKLIVKLDKFQSKIKESVGGERQMKGKMGNNEADGVHVQDVGPSVTLAKKKRALINEESVSGVWRQERSARGLLIARCSTPTIGNELDNASTPKLLQSIETGCKKNDSKPDRRLKRLSPHKGLSNDVPLQNSSSPDCTGESDDDQEELLSAANHASCSSSFWKKTEPAFAPISSEEKSFFAQQVDSDALPSEERRTRLLFQVDSDALPSEERRTRKPRQQTEETKTHMPHQQMEFFCKNHDVDDKTSNGCTPFYQRVLSALIVEDDNNIDGLQEGDASNIQIQNSFSVSTSDTYHLNNSERRKKARVENNCDTTFSICGQSLRLAKKSFTSNGSTNPSTVYEDVHSEVKVLAGTSKSIHGCQYEQMSIDDKLLLELQCIGLCPDTLPGLEDNEDETILHEVGNLQTALHQQENKKKSNFEKISEDAESNPGVRDLETLAMDQSDELGTRKSSKSGILKVPKEAALSSGKRTLAGCQKFENSGRNCFNELPLKDVLSAPTKNKPEKHTDSVDWHADSQPDPKLLSGEAFAVNRPSNRGKNKKLLLNNVGTTARTTISSETKGKRTARTATKPPRAPKPKPRQKTNTQPPTPEAKCVNKPTEPPHPTQPSVNNRRDVQSASSEVNDHTNPPPVDDLDLIDELGVAGGPHDLSSLLTFNIEDPELDLDMDFAEGLAVPDDDLSGLGIL